MSAASSFRITTAEADALGWADLAYPDPPDPPKGNRQVVDPVDEPILLGVAKARQHGVKGDLSLDVLLDPAGTWIDIGGYRFDLIDACYLGVLLKIARAITRPPQTASANPPWEGETRP